VKRPCVYILQCSDGTYYTGSTTNLPQRLAQHESGTVSGYASCRVPFHLVYVCELPTIIEAASAEQQIKGWTRAKKEALIGGDFELLKQLATCRNRTNARFKE
jgi:predicted GIY-YIG superfamily endonuclease